MHVASVGVVMCDGVFDGVVIGIAITAIYADVCVVVDIVVAVVFELCCCCDVDVVSL